MIEIFKQFTFEAAHQLGANVEPGHPYSNIHGHSYKVEIYLQGEPDPETDWLQDFTEIDECLATIRKQLDHQFLNSINGIGTPTLENISKWIWESLEPSVPNLSQVIVRRETCGEGCIYKKGS